MTNTINIQKYQIKAIKHGSIGILIGLLAGIALMVSVLGEISGWSFFSISASVPGTPSMWRGTHIGPILNGLMCIGLAASLSFLNPIESQAKKICNYLSYMVWGNCIFYIVRMWGTNRGLALHTEKFGMGNFADAIAMFPAAIAVYWGLYATVLIILLAHKRQNF